MNPTRRKNRPSSRTEMRIEQMQRIWMVVLLAVLIAWPTAEPRSQDLPPIPTPLLDALKELGIDHPEFVAVAVPDENKIRVYGTAPPAPAINFNRFIHQPVHVQAPGPWKVGPNDDVEMVILKLASPGNGIYCQRGGQCTAQ